MEPVRAERWRARGVRGLGFLLRIQGRHHHFRLTRIFAPNSEVHPGPDVIRALFDGASRAGVCVGERRSGAADRRCFHGRRDPRADRIGPLQDHQPGPGRAVRARNEYFRQQAERTHDFPHYGPRQYAVSTFKSWLKYYEDSGFEGLKPESRSDCGAPRKLVGELLDSIRIQCELFPEWSAQLHYEEFYARGLLGDPPACYNTLLRTLKREGLLQKLGRSDRRKRFETGETNELWLCDFMHGPPVRVDRKTRKAILCAVIDDHSRLIVGHAFNPHETVSSLTVVLKEAFLAHGVPKRLYVDNGAAFSAGLLLKTCAQAGVSLIHSKPYDSPSRGKIERFFRTVRDRFLPGIQGVVSLDDLNLAFDCWLRDDYHHRVHSGIGQRPVDRHHASAGRVEIRRLTEAELDQAFLVRHERVVNHDATISFKGRIYEVPAAYIRQRVELRHTVDDPDTLILYDGGKQVSVLKLVDVRDNARSFKPKVEAEAMSFSDGRVRE